MFLDTSFLKDGEIFLKAYAHIDGDETRGWLPAYHFMICTLDGTEIGHCDLRIGHNENTYYGGNIGYCVKEEYRGHHYAGKACRLLFSLARLHGLQHLIITCNPDNLPSRKTCEYAGGVLEGIADLPEGNDMYQNGERQKCIYRFAL